MFQAKTPLWLVFPLCGIVLLSASLVGQGQSPWKVQPTPTGDPDPSESKIASEAARIVATTQAIQSQRQAVIKELMRIAATQPESGSPEDNAYAWAVTMLGKLRAEEAVDILLDNINYSWSPTGFRSDDRYLVIDALLQIGLPALSPTLERLAKEGADEGGYKLRYNRVLKKMLGEEVAEAVLRHAIDQADMHGQTERRAALEDALDLFKGRPERPSTTTAPAP
jgi:hypothetical protein